MPRQLTGAKPLHTINISYRTFLQIPHHPVFNRFRNQSHTATILHSCHFLGKETVRQRYEDSGFFQTARNHTLRQAQTQNGPPERFGRPADAAGGRRDGSRMFLGTRKPPGKASNFRRSAPRRPYTKDPEAADRPDRNSACRSDSWHRHRGGTTPFPTSGARPAENRAHSRAPR